MLNAQNRFSIKDFGATGNKDQNATTFIQKAIDACANQGGGEVYFPPGNYTSSTFNLKSNVTLHLEAGSTLFASTNPADYTATKGIYSTETDVPVLIYGDMLKTITITGRGTIDGQASHTWEPLREIDNFIAEETENARKAGIEMSRAYAKDPKVSLFYLTNCDDVLICDISILHSPNWAMHIAHSKRINIRNVYIFSSLSMGVNSDGIDIDGCQDVKISDCTVITGDDAICLKSTSKNNDYQPCEYITITNCTLVSTSTALKIGTESHGDFRHIIFSNSVIRDSNRGIGIFVRDGAHVSQVIFSNLTIDCNRKHFNWWGDGDPIRFVLLKRNPDSRLGSIEEVTIDNVTAKGQGSSLIAGHENQSLKNIRLSNVKLHITGESLADKRASSGLILKKIDGIRLDNVFISWDKKKPEAKWAHGIYAQQCSQLQFNQVKASPGGKAPATAGLTLENCVDAKITGFTTTNSEKRGILVTGNSSKQIEVGEENRSITTLQTDIPKKSVVFN